MKRFMFASLVVVCLLGIGIAQPTPKPFDASVRTVSSDTVGVIAG